MAASARLSGLRGRGLLFTASLTLALFQTTLPLLSANEKETTASEVPGVGLPGPKPIWSVDRLRANRGC